MLRRYIHKTLYFERHKGNVLDKVFYTESLKELLLQPTEEQFNVSLSQKLNGYTYSFGNQIPPWDPAFVEYFNKKIMVEIELLVKFHIEIASQPGSSQPLIGSAAAGEEDSRSCFDCGKYFHFK